MNSHEQHELGALQSKGRSPIVYAAAGAVVTLIVVAFLAAVFWPSGPAAEMAAAGGPPGSGEGAAGGMGFGPMSVETAHATETIAAEPVELVGSAAPHRQSVIASEVEGVVAEIVVDEGYRVRSGALLAQLDTTTAELDLEAALASREEASARLIRFEAELARMTDLMERNAISQRELDQAIADRDAQAQSVVRFTADAARLEEIILKARIVAPYAGQVSAVHVELGEWVQRGGEVVTLVDLAQVEVTVPVPERYVSAADQARRAGVRVPVMFDAIPGRTFEGEVIAIIPEANPGSRTFPALVAVDNPENLIQGGMVARVLAQVGDPMPTVLVPKDALVLRGGFTFVMRVQPMSSAGGAAGGEQQAAGSEGRQGGGPPMGMVEELQVEIGAAVGAWQAIKGQIASGDIVVVRGNENLRSGMPVILAGEIDFEPPPPPDPDRPLAGRVGQEGDR
jgi:membrane fusion protein (multidrug efflux system)